MTSKSFAKASRKPRAAAKGLATRKAAAKKPAVKKSAARTQRAPTSKRASPYVVFDSPLKPKHLTEEQIKRAVEELG
jgi:hypothetical protein